MPITAGRKRSLEREVGRAEIQYSKFKIQKIRVKSPGQGESWRDALPCEGSDTVGTPLFYSTREGDEIKQGGE